jgi:hypothetical protein
MQTQIKCNERQAIVLQAAHWHDNADIVTYGSSLLL